MQRKEFEMFESPGFRILCGFIGFRSVVTTTVHAKHPFGKSALNRRWVSMISLKLRYWSRLVVPCPLSTCTSTPSCLLHLKAPEVEKVGKDALELCVQVIDLGLGILRSHCWEGSAQVCDHVMYHAAPVDQQQFNQISRFRIAGYVVEVRDCKGPAGAAFARVYYARSNEQRKAHGWVFGWLLLPSCMHSGMPWYHVMTFVGVDILDLDLPLPHPGF